MVAREGVKGHSVAVSSVNDVSQDTSSVDVLISNQFLI